MCWAFLLLISLFSYYSERYFAKNSLKTIPKHIAPLLLLICSFQIIPSLAADPRPVRDTTPFSTQAQAIAFIQQIKELPPSAYWPNVKPALFLQNLQNNIYNPDGLHEGNNTNFCAYAAVTYIPLHNDPLGFVKHLLKLYLEGKVKIGRVLINPSPEIKQAAGRLNFKGELDIRHADQLWFLCLADHFKGYLNLFDRHFDMGDENRFWAATNYSKFNHMIRSLFNYRVQAKGSDLIRIRTDDLYAYLKEKLQTGIVALYVNNMALYQKDHRVIKPGIPTHFIILENIEEANNGMINIIYWDYGAHSLQQVTRSFLERLIFGVTLCTKRTIHAKQ